MRLVAKLIPTKQKTEEFERRFPDFRTYFFDAIQATFLFANELEKAMDQYFTGRCERFSRARFLVLMVVFFSEDARINPNEIAKKLNVTRGNMTGLIDGLVSDGYVTKDQDQDDRRQVWIAITPAGRKLLDRILPNYFKKISKLMSGIKKDELIQFTKLLVNLESKVSEAFSLDESGK